MKALHPRKSRSSSGDLPLLESIGIKPEGSRAIPPSIQWIGLPEQISSQIISLTRLCEYFLVPSSSSVRPVAGFGKDAESPGTPQEIRLLSRPMGEVRKSRVSLPFQLGLDQIPVNLPTLPQGSRLVPVIDLIEAKAHRVALCPLEIVH